MDWLGSARTIAISGGNNASQKSQLNSVSSEYLKPHDQGQGVVVSLSLFLVWSPWLGFVINGALLHSQSQQFARWSSARSSCQQTALFDSTSLRFSRFLLLFVPSLLASFITAFSSFPQPDCLLCSHCSLQQHSISQKQQQQQWKVPSSFHVVDRW